MAYSSSIARTVVLRNTSNDSHRHQNLTNHNAQNKHVNKPTTETQFKLSHRETKLNRQTAQTLRIKYIKNNIEVGENKPKIVEGEKGIRRSNRIKNAKRVNKMGGIEYF